jgi:rhodanese-related sulfurtransferase
MREKKPELASFVLIGLLLASIFVGAVSGADVGGAEEGIDNITIKEAEEIINSQNVVVLDVRAQAEYESGHIAGAKLIPVSELEGGIDGLDKDKTIIIYCESGSRSEKAREILAQHGFKNGYNMLGGITAWIDAGLPTTSFLNTQTPLPFMPNNNSLSSAIDDVLDDKHVFLFFYTDWCHFCHQQMPIIDELEKEYAGKLAFIRINVNERPDYAEEFGVSALPTMFIISGKNEAGYAKQEISGLTEKARLKEIIDLEIGQSEQTVIGDIDESGIPEDANYNSSMDEGKSNSNVLSSLSSGIAYAGNYELLIIAPDEFIDELKLLKDFKDATGRPTILLSLSEIYSNPSCTGVDAPEKIKKCIAHYEKSTGIEYVMLVGDCDKFPVRFVCIHTPERDKYTRGFEPADLYYADLSRPDGDFDDWDIDNDGLYAERNYYKNGEMNLDKVNFYPEIAVGRIPASNLTEVTTYIKR